MHPPGTRGGLTLLYSLGLVHPFEHLDLLSNFNLMSSVSRPQKPLSFGAHEPLG